MHDIVIKNGTIIDGSGAAMYLGDIAVNNGVITEMGDLGGEKARTEIDAEGLCVCPGFIDISNRSDVYWRLFQDAYLESLLRQGITTIIGGNSGASLAPHYNEQMFLSTQKWTNVTGTNVNWESVADFFAVLKEKKLSMNFGMFVGHGTLRRGIIGDETRELSLPESRSLVSHLEKGLIDGALGASLGLVYSHERSTSAEELEHVATCVQKYNGLLAVHLRDEGRDLITALDEVFGVVRETGVRTHITHLKAVGQDAWPLMREAIESIDQMILDGFDVSFDIYPYTVTGSVLYTFLPGWISEGGKGMLLGRLKNQPTYNQVLKEMRTSKLKLDEAIVSLAPHAKHLRGRTLHDIAQERETDVSQLILDLLIASEGRVIILFDALSEENVVRGLKSPYSVVTSNSPGYTITDEVKGLQVHPRSFGTFPRLMDRYVKERGVLSLELAIHKSSYKVANRLGIMDRGLLRQGFAADIVIFDPLTITDTATLSKPLSYAKGITYVIINGEFALYQEKATQLQLGQILRRTHR